MIVTKSGDRLCGWTPPKHLIACTLPYGHGGDQHSCEPDVLDGILRDGYTYFPDPDPPDDPGPCETTACFLPHNHDGAHVTAWYDTNSRLFRPPCRVRSHDFGSCHRPIGHPGWHGRTPVGSTTPIIWPPDPEEDTAP